MAVLSNLGSLFSDVKTRTILLFTIVLIVGGIGIGISRLGKKEVGDISGGSSLKGAPSVQSIPGVGERPSENYISLQRESNTVNAQRAIKKGTSAIPTLTEEFSLEDAIAGDGQGKDKSSQSLSDIKGSLSDAQRDAMLSKQRADQLAARNAAANKLLADLQKQMQAQQAQLQQQQAQLASQGLLATKEAQKQKQVLQTAMTGQIQSMLGAWNRVAPLSSQSSAEATAAAAGDAGGAGAGGAAGKDGDQADGEGAAGRPGDESGAGAGGLGGRGLGDEFGFGSKGYDGPIRIKAGSILYAVLDTAVNSDEPGPVTATVVQGLYKGAKVVGALKRVNAKVVLKFSLMNLPAHVKSTGITAVAIDPNSARTALASGVNHHYMLRYGTLFASSFLKGLGSAVKSSGGTVNATTTGTTETAPKLDTGDKLITAFGEVGSKWGAQLSPIFGTPPTVVVKTGTGIGLLFTQDVYEKTAA